MFVCMDKSVRVPCIRKFVALPPHPTPSSSCSCSLSSSHCSRREAGCRATVEGAVRRWRRLSHREARGGGGDCSRQRGGGPLAGSRRPLRYKLAAPTWVTGGVAQIRAPPPIQIHGPPWRAPPPCRGGRAACRGGAWRPWVLPPLLRAARRGKGQCREPRRAPHG